MRRGRKSGTLLSTGYPDNSPRKESTVVWWTSCLRSDEPLLRETLRKQTDSTKTDSTNNTNVLTYSVITSWRMWKYPTRYPFFFFHFVYFFPPPISFLSSFSFRISHSIDENNNSRFPRDLVILQMDAAGNDTEEKLGWKVVGKKERRER